MTLARSVTVAGPGIGRYEAKGSVFLGRVERVATEDEARAVIDRARREHHDARHHCSAFVLGPDGRITRSNDDGEPSGTAGAPILQVLVGAGVSDVGAVVTRWFGGTLLGAGGLVRAYTAAAQAALADAGTLVRELRTLVEISVPAAQAGKLENTVRQAGADVGEVRWADPVIIPAAVRDPDGLARLVAEVSGGAAELAVVGQSWVDVEGAGL
ncbi:IMPACT family protein [Microlunatus parietis]|uniref:Putative YigZ family protein n=1 Tax=Microlunatus parietis TaxID=682979 RepID=A0A7Y9LCX8_9ACTN|nr:YigZ family protein [Microlunatus parietis]NYE72180.1 putative YigZ family protein [Microlunatus parietis]